MKKQQTELTNIQKWLKEYYHPTSGRAFANAMRRLEKVHKKYGTIDINIIKQLIN